MFLTVPTHMSQRRRLVWAPSFFVGTYIYEVQSWVRGVIVMDKTAFFTMPSGLYVVSAAADGLRAGCVINTAVQVCLLYTSDAADE